MALTLKQWRRVKDLTQKDMSNMLNVHINTYQNWEENPEKISVKHALNIAEIFNVSINDITFKKSE